MTMIGQMKKMMLIKPLDENFFEFHSNYMNKMYCLIYSRMPIKLYNDLRSHFISRNNIVFSEFDSNFMSLI